MPKRSFSGFLALLIILSFGCAAVSIKLLQYRFGAYDLSPLIDSVWRVLSGQVPNRDFICTFPPILYLAVALAFRIFGVRWLAIPITGVLFPVLLTLAGLRVITRLRVLVPDLRLG